MALRSSHLFVNLPVKHVKASMAFFQGLGFEFNLQFTDEEKAACLVIGENMFVMLTEEAFFTALTQKEVLDTHKYAQMALVLSVESREKVDEVVHTAAVLGGKIISEPEDHGFMYQWGFQDPNGHLWAISHFQ